MGLEERNVREASSVWEAFRGCAASDPNPFSCEAISRDIFRLFAARSSKVNGRSAAVIIVLDDASVDLVVETLFLFGWIEICARDRKLPRACACLWEERPLPFCKDKLL